MCGKVHWHNCRTQEEENPYVVMENECESPELNMWCALICDSVLGSFFAEGTIT